MGLGIELNAIMKTLMNSKHLIHLDLSFNPLLTYCLDTLQHHVESFDTLTKLQVLSLKGSLRFTRDKLRMSSLITFSSVISSRCQDLQRLDLSENYFGEPGNSDLSKVISQLINMKKIFNLRLNEEYMSKVEENWGYQIIDL